MRPTGDGSERQLRALWEYLALTRSRTLPLCEQITRDAAIGNVHASRVIGSRIFESPTGGVSSAYDIHPGTQVNVRSVAVSAQPPEVIAISATRWCSAWRMSCRVGSRHDVRRPKLRGLARSEHWPCWMAGMT